MSFIVFSDGSGTTCGPAGIGWLVTLADGVPFNEVWTRKLERLLANDALAPGDVIRPGAVHVEARRADLGAVRLTFRRTVAHEPADSNRCGEQDDERDLHFRIHLATGSIMVRVLRWRSARASWYLRRMRFLTGVG